MSHPLDCKHHGKSETTLGLFSYLHSRGYKADSSQVFEWMNTLINHCIYEALLTCQLLCKVHCCSNIKQRKINENTLYTLKALLNVGCENDIFISCVFFNQLLTCSFKSELLDYVLSWRFYQGCLCFFKNGILHCCGYEMACTIHALLHEAPQSVLVLYNTDYELFPVMPLYLWNTPVYSVSMHSFSHDPNTFTTRAQAIDYRALYGQPHSMSSAHCKYSQWLAHYTLNTLTPSPDSRVVCTKHSFLHQALHFW